eukprot:TRINITY_DN15765_c0_g1_i1.p2 TRINITY_DN15765_c0_g1~~TRINITY_DN15765_c0_g1_i1.p2  ORF type:complete len:128 (+),score=29.99 TRINITY_DN15765_c0_g1_i1:68-451(+)
MENITKLFVNDPPHTTVPELDPKSFGDANFKSDWLNQHLKKRESEFTKTFPVYVLMASWNVNGQKPGESLNNWLNSTEEIPDIVCVGFQELDLTAEALLLREVPERTEPWEKIVMETLNSRGQYEMF